MELYPAFHISPKLLEAAQHAEELARPQFAEIESIQRYNQQKMLAAFSKAGVSESHFVGSTGYGYGDRGRDVLDQVYAYAFGAEDALVRHNFVSGTHTLTVALFGMLCAPGTRCSASPARPTTPCKAVIGMEGREEPGSLKEFGIQYEELDLLPRRHPRPGGHGAAHQPGVQDDLHPALPGLQPAPLPAGGGHRRPLWRLPSARRRTPLSWWTTATASLWSGRSPPAVGADLIAGSLIKNPGGGIAPTGGYIAGRAGSGGAVRLPADHPWHRQGDRLHAGQQPGAVHGRCSMPPTWPARRLKTARVCLGAVLRSWATSVTPDARKSRAATSSRRCCLGKPEDLIAFCKGVQKGAPVDSFVVPRALGHARL